jgi:hypothetical protein
MLRLVPCASLLSYDANHSITSQSTRSSFQASLEHARHKTQQLMSHDNIGIRLTVVKLVVLTFPSDS